MNVKELVDEVSRRTDTPGTTINRAETGRVVAVLFDVLADLPPLDALDLVSREFRRRAKQSGSRSTHWISSRAAPGRAVGPGSEGMA